MGRYARGSPKKLLSKIAKIDTASIDIIKTAISILPGTEGKSAYEIAVDNGFIGTELQWLLSLKGRDGLPGSDADVTTHESTYNHLNIHTSGSDNQDLSGLQPKETGKGLSSNDYTTIEKDKLSGLSNYTHPTNHSPSIITQDVLNRFVSDTEKSTWNGKEPGNSNIQTHVTSTHAPSNAQKNSDIIQSEIEAKLTGVISTHSHSEGADPFIAKLVLLADKPTGANVTPVTLGLSFNYEINSRYVIDFYMIVAPTAATTGCGFMIDVSTAVTYVGTFVSHQLAITGTLSGAGSIGDLAVISSGVSSGMVSTASQFIYGGGLLITTTNTGTATFFFRSETTAITTCKAGSIIRVMKI